MEREPGEGGAGGGERGGEAGAGRGGGSAGARGRGPGEGPGAAGGRAAPGARLGSRRPPAVRRDAVRGSRIGRASQGPAPARPERVSARSRVPPGEGSAGASCGLQSGHCGRPKGAGAGWARLGAWALVTRSVPPLGAFGREARGEEDPRGPAQPEGRVPGRSRTPSMEDGPRQRPEVAAGSRERVRGVPSRGEIW